MAGPDEGANSLAIALASIVDALDVRACFADGDRPLELELGAGDGSFLLEWARRNPQANFIGVERLKGRLSKIDRRGRREGMDNLRVLRLEASYAVRYVLPSASVKAVHIYFPDPWPKRRHHRRRLIQPAFVESLKRILASNGRVYLRTDHKEYFDWIKECFDGDPDFVQAETPAGLAEVTTDFERDFNASDVATLRAAYALVPGGEPGEISGRTG